MYKSAGIILVSDNVLNGRSSNRTEEFIIKQLNLLNYKVETLVIVPENKNVLIKQVETHSKQFDVSIVIGELNNSIVFEALENLCNCSENEHNANKVFKLDSKEKSLTLPAATKLLSKDNLSFPVIYLHRIFILKEEYVEVQFFEVLKSHLKQFSTLPIYKKDIQVHMNGSSKKVIDILNKLVSVNSVKNGNILTLALSSSNLENILEAEKMLRTDLGKNFLESSVDEDALMQIYNNGDDYIHKSLEVIEECFSLYGPENTFLSFNGGKDCTVLLHLVYTVLKIKYPDYKKPIFCLYVKSRDPFPEQDLFIDQCQIYYNLDIMVVVSSIKDALQQVLTSKPNLKACFMGTRKTDPFSENLRSFHKTDSDWPQVIRVNSILGWHYSDIWDFLLFYKIPYCKLYDMGYTSIGNLSNTIRNPCLLYFDVKLNRQVYLPAYKLLKESEERNGRNVVNKT